MDLFRVIFFGALGCIALVTGVSWWINTDRIVDSHRDTGKMNPEHSRTLQVFGWRALAVNAVVLGGAILFSAFTLTRG